MEKFKKITTAALAALILFAGGTAGSYIATRYTLSESGVVKETNPAGEAVTSLPAAGDVKNPLVSIVKRSSPAVVNIDVESMVTQQPIMNPFQGHPFFDEFFGEEFFGPQQPRKVPRRGKGSGFIVSKDGYILTNNHVVEGAQTIEVTLNDGRSFDGTVVGTDANTDIAVVHVDATDLTAAEFGDSSSLVTGEPVYVIGNPLGTQFAETMTDGIVSAPSREVAIDNYIMNLIQTNAAINPGNSGGPMFNSQGQVVGVVNAKIMQSNANDVEGIGFAIPIETALNVANDLIEYGYVTDRPVLGVSVQSLTTQEALFYRLEPGLIVKEVTAGGPAEAAGVQVNDKIVAFNGVEVEDFTELNYEKDKYEPGDTITLTVERNGSRIDLPLVLGTSSN